MNVAKELYIYVTSDTSDIYPDNDQSDFKVVLPQLVKTEGIWYVGLQDINLPKLKDNYKPDFLVISCSICGPSYYENSLLPVLQRLYFGEIKSGRPLRFDSPRYVTVNSDTIDSLEFHITDDQGEKPSFKAGKSNCTLHLRKEIDQRLQ